MAKLCYLVSIELVMNKNKFSDKYYKLITEYKNAHKNGIIKNDILMPSDKTFGGHSLIPWVEPIKQIILNTKSKSILDYGCGKAKLYINDFEINNKKYKNLKEYWDISEIKLYDPGVEDYEHYPAKKYDGVICTDVLEHIFIDDLNNVVKDIMNFSNKFVFFVISTVLDKKFLANGENVHVTVKDETWWKSFFEKIKNDFSKLYCVVIITKHDEKENKFKRIV